MNNTKLWDAVKRPPTTALKAIQAGRLKGKTDINPQWRMQALTEQFGPCGIGWRYTIDRLWTEPGSAEQVMAFALVSLYISQDSAWSDPIPGIGGAAMIARESSGLHSNDEAYKMAVTDALSVAMKALGVAADIYAGLWDGSKYKDQQAETKKGKGTIKPTDGAMESLSPDQQIAARDDAEYIIQLWDGGDKGGAYEAWMTVGEGDNTYKVAVWSVLGGRSDVRNGLKKIHDEQKETAHA